MLAIPEGLRRKKLPDYIPASSLSSSNKKRGRPKGSKKAKVRKDRWGNEVKYMDGDNANGAWNVDTSENLEAGLEDSEDEQEGVPISSIPLRALHTTERLMVIEKAGGAENVNIALPTGFGSSQVVLSRTGKSKSKSKSKIV
tara:strand:- start:539 stop:964 length:426 start_codon:yes stop_codon:yes gene_type:complete